jgi:hypothetical protein
LQTAQLAELTGLSKLKAERDIAIAQTEKLGKAGKKAAEEFTQAFNISGRNEALKELEKVIGEMKKGDNGKLPSDLQTDKNNLQARAGQIFLDAQSGKTTLDQLIPLLADVNAQVQDIFIRQNWFETQDKAAKAFSEGLKKQIAEDKAALDGMKREWEDLVAPEKGRLQGQQQAISDAASRNIRLAQAQSMPGDEVGTMNQVQRIRLQAAQDEYDRAMKLAKLHLDDAQRERDEAKATEVLKRQISDAELDRTIQIMDLRKKELEQFRDSAGRIFDAISQHGFAGLKDVAQGMMQTVQRTIFQNLAEEIFRQTRDKMKLGDMIGGQVDKNGNLTTTGRILRGTPLGIDPAKLAQDQNTAAHKDQTVATRELKQATVDLTAAMQSGAAGAGAAGAGGSTDSLGSAVSSIVDDKKMSGMTAKLGQAMAIGAGAFGVYSGIKEGGAKGVLNAAGGSAAIAGQVLPLISSSLKAAGPIGALVGFGLSMLGGLFGSDNKQKFDQAQTDTLNANKYTAPLASNRTVDLSGADVDYTYMGRLRAAQAPPMQVNFTIHAMDAKSFMDRSGDVAAALHKELRLGHPVGLDIQQAILGS